MDEADRMELSDLSRAWWLPVVLGVVMVLYSFAVLSFTITTINAVAYGLGIGLLFAGFAELMLWRQVESWRWLVLIAGVVDIILAVMAFAWPDATFLVLARLIGWVLLLRGIIEIVRAFDDRHRGVPTWWAGMIIGVFNIVDAIWATRYPGREIVVLVLWVGIAVLTRGVLAIVAGFTLRGMGKRLAAA